jgi:hypothetical protein
LDLLSEEAAPERTYGVVGCSRSASIECAHAVRSVPGKDGIILSGAMSQTRSIRGRRQIAFMSEPVGALET